MVQHGAKRIRMNETYRVRILLSLFHVVVVFVLDSFA